jgi:hypothetical protein
LEVRRYSQPGSTSYEDFRFRFFLKKQIWFFYPNRKFG